MNNSFDQIQSDELSSRENWEAAQEVEQEEKEECKRCGYPEDYRWGKCRDCWEACGE